eukprot:m.137853 g.137853  ORF g.137853 m.137853 type:complete len:361 (+) comp12482_c0_seq1:141-1223(+)
MDSIPNFRDALASVVHLQSSVASSSDKKFAMEGTKGAQGSDAIVFRGGKLFRSGAPACVTVDDLKKLTNELNVRTIVDLRGRKEEQKNITCGALLTHHVYSPATEVAELFHFSSVSTVEEGIATTKKIFEDTTSRHAYDNLELRDRPLTDDEEQVVAELIAPDKKIRLQYNIPLVKEQSIKTVLMAELTWLETLYISSMAIVGMTLLPGWYEEVKVFMKKKMNGKGMTYFYKIILNHSKTELCEALKVIACDEHHACLVNCHHGKDRTGVLIALVLKILGVPNEIIAEDYHLSEAYSSSKEGRSHLTSLKGLDVDIWCLAKKDTMLEVLSFLDEEGIDAYCDGIGFNEEWRNQLKSIFIV